MTAKKRAMTAAERKRAQRQRDLLAGWVEVKVKVAKDQAQAVRDFAAALPPPSEPHDPRQLDMLEAINRILAQDREARSADHADDRDDGDTQGNLL